MDREQFFADFNNGLHRIGRTAMVLMIGALLAVPVVFGAINGLSPDWAGFLDGIIKVGIIYYPTSIVEFLIYTPMLGVGGSYLSFLTGNVTNMRIPCAMNATAIAKTEPGTPEQEIVTTIAVATSAITTTLVILAGVLALVPLQPVLQNPVLQPAFNNVVPALFGALAASYFGKHLKLCVAPLLAGVIVLIFSPAMGAGTLMFITIVAAVAGVGVLYKLKWL